MREILFDPEADRQYQQCTAEQKEEIDLAVMRLTQLRVPGPPAYRLRGFARRMNEPVYYARSGSSKSLVVAFPRDALLVLAVLDRPDVRLKAK
jgi:hypothetical protein